MSGPPKILAELLEPVEAETPYGGRSTTYLPLGLVWLRPKTVSERNGSWRSGRIPRPGGPLRRARTGG